jgi:putative phosphoribosyl transferase
MILASREEAARKLAEKLGAYRGRNPLVLAVPRGGVVMGGILAAELDGELDVVLVRKIGAPGNPEYAIGGIDESGAVELRAAAHRMDLPAGYVEEEGARQLALLGERRRRYTPGRASAVARDRVVIVVDDGVATGATLRSALDLVRRQAPRRLIAALGVAPRAALAELRAHADEVVCLLAPREFHAVGQFYGDFRQVEDAEAIAVLRAAAARRERIAAAEAPATGSR